MRSQLKIYCTIFRVWVVALMWIAVIPVFAQDTVATEANADDEAEVQLNLAVEVSSETNNEAALVGQITRTQFLYQGDRLDVSQRLSGLRKELGANYAMPTQRAGFSLVTNELLIAETKRYITENRKLTTQQATYRNMWASGTRYGVFAIGAGAEAVRLETASDSAPFLLDFIERQGRTSYALPLIASWSLDQRAPKQVLPEGMRNQLTFEWGTPIGNIHYVKADVLHETFIKLGNRVSAGWQVSLGGIEPATGDLPPLTKRYFGGGTGSVRGYEASVLSPLDSSGAATGAYHGFTATLEAMWHAFNIGQTPVILSGFADTGRFSRMENSAISLAKASSFGVGVSLPVRIGLVRFSFANPIDGEFRAQRFQFEARANW